MQVGTRRVHTGRVIDLDVDTVKYPDGSTGELEMIRHPGASAVVPVLADPGGKAREGRGTGGVCPPRAPGGDGHARREDRAPDTDLDHAGLHRRAYTS